MLKYTWMGGWMVGGRLDKGITTVSKTLTPSLKKKRIIYLTCEKRAKRVLRTLGLSFWVP